MATIDEIRRLLNSGVSYSEASKRKDVAYPAAISSTDVTSANAVTPANAAYSVADQTALANLVNELKTDHNALRAEVVNLHGVVNALLDALDEANLTL